MNQEPFAFKFPISDFDLSKLPVDPALLRGNPGMLVTAIQTFYQESFRNMGGTATILIKDGVVTVAWYPLTGDASKQVFEHAVNLLRQGDYRTAEPLLRSLLERDANDSGVLFNLGMMLSDQRKMEEATAFLARYVELVPKSSHGWTSLGVAQSRKGETESALNSLERALKLDPQNAYALRNLGALISPKAPQDALPFLERAARLMPDDQLAQNAYAQCLLQLDRPDEADPVFAKVIQLSPLSDIAESARTARTSIAHQTMRSNVGGAPRPDAIMYCLDGLQKFRDLGKVKTGAVVFEIAMLGNNGLDINDPAKKYTLRSLPGAFSGLQLVSLMYTGMQQINPGVDAGIDLSQEFTMAKKLYEK